MYLNYFILAWIYPGYLLVQKQQMLSVRPALGKEFRLSFDIRMEPIKRKSHILSINSNDNLNRLRVVIGNNKKYCEIRFLKYKYDCRITRIMDMWKFLKSFCPSCKAENHSRQQDNIRRLMV
jgi:hypothetical protein